MWGLLKRLTLSCLLLLSFAFGQQAEAAAPVQPALFKIVNGKSTVYIFGSIHVLPLNFQWRTPAIDQAIGAADVFIFEARPDFATTEFHYFMDQKGYLPRGQRLHKMLSPAAREQYFALVNAARIDLNRLDYLRPGVAVMMLNQWLALSPGGLGPGVDAMLMGYVKERKKQTSYLESLQSQFEVMMIVGGGDDVSVLEKNLASKDDIGKKYRAILAAWAKGDLAQLIALGDEDPEQRVLVFDKRNKAWMPRIETMLGAEKTYFVTVGAGHLAGTNGVIDLLCAKKWKVERLQTGPTVPPLACRS